MSSRHASPLAGEPSRAEKPRGLLARYFSRFDEGEVVRWAFRGLLIGAIAVLALDLRDLARDNGWLEWPDSPAETALEPILPPALGDDRGGGGIDPRDDLAADPDELRRAARLSLEPGGVLTLTGTLDRGVAARFEAELAARGEYVRTISLNSPGGSLDDALAISRLIREKAYATEVAAGALCASSCPLVLAGGASRKVDARGAVGVHQFYAAETAEAAPAQIMADTQATTARIARHLETMGVDPALWVHAMETSPRRLYYLSAEEIAGYRLANGG